MRHTSVIRAVAGFLACGCATALCQGCDNPGTVGGGGGGAGGARVTFNLGLGGQTAVRARGSGGIIADAASGDVLAARKDARLEGTAPEVQEPPSKNADAPAAVDRSAMHADVRQAADPAAAFPDARPSADQAAPRDVPAKEAVVRNTPPAIDASPHADVGVPDEQPSGDDAPPRDGPAVDLAAATGCSYGGVTYAVGDSFPNDCNTCFCLAGGDVACTVKACSVDGGLESVVGWVGP